MSAVLSHCSLSVMLAADRLSALEDMHLPNMFCMCGHFVVALFLGVVGRKRDGVPVLLLQMGGFSVTVFM